MLILNAIMLVYEMFELCYQVSENLKLNATELVIMLVYLLCCG